MAWLKHRCGESPPCGSWERFLLRPVSHCFWTPSLVSPHQGLGTPAPIFPMQHLVVSGLFRPVRNPIYVAVLLLILVKGCCSAMCECLNTGLPFGSDFICSSSGARSRHCGKVMFMSTKNPARMDQGGFRVYDLGVKELEEVQDPEIKPREEGVFRESAGESSLWIFGRHRLFAIH